MRRIVILTAAVLTACQPAPAHVDLGPDEMARLGLHHNGSIDLLFATTLDACFSCQIQGGFIALRNVQRTGDSGLAPKLTALLVVRNLDDTLAFSQTLKYNRIAANIKSMTPRDAKRIIDLRRIPAIYLIENGRIFRKWESRDQAPVVMGGNDIREALVEIRNAQAAW